MNPFVYATLQAICSSVVVMVWDAPGWAVVGTFFIVFNIGLAKAT